MGIPCCPQIFVDVVVYNLPGTSRRMYEDMARPWDDQTAVNK